jgi:hypothetical protein
MASRRSAVEAKLNAAGIYVVAAVVGERAVAGGKEYKVRWEGYGPQDECVETHRFKRLELAAIFESEWVGKTRNPDGCVLVLPWLALLQHVGAGRGAVAICTEGSVGVCKAANQGRISNSSLGALSAQRPRPPARLLAAFFLRCSPLRADQSRDRASDGDQGCLAQIFAAGLRRRAR